MRGTKGSFERTGEISREASKTSDWLEEFAEKLAIAEVTSEARVKTASKTAVEVSRDRNIGPSVYEMMSAIVSPTGHKHSSVEEAVVDYQKRTGLAQHLERTAEEQMQAVASLVTASYGEDEACAHGEHGDCAECDAADAADADTANADTEEEEEDSPKADGHGEVAEDDEDIEHFLELLEGFDYPDSYERTDIGNAEWSEEHDSLVAQAEHGHPALVIQVPAIDSFLDNLIDTNPGIQLPALLHSLVETFSRDGADQSSCREKDFLQYVNKKLIDKERDIIDPTSSEIGRGVGLHVDYTGESDQNKHPFALLEPQESE